MDNGTKTKSSALKWLVLFNFLLTIALAAGLYGGYYWFKLQMSGTLANFDATIQQVNQNVIAQQAKLEELRTNVDNLGHRLDKITPNQIVISQVGELIYLANQNLIAYNDVSGCKRLLTFAQKLLSDDNDPGFADLKQAIAFDLERLNNAKTFDALSITGKLNAINDEVNELSVIKHQVQVMAPIKSDSKWQLFLDNAKRSLLNLVNINSSAHVQVLLPEDESIAKQNIRLNLYGAKLALLSRDPKLWSDNLQAAKNTLSQYFASYNGVETIENSLERLANIDIANSSVNIDQTVNAWHRLQVQGNE